MSKRPKTVPAAAPPGARGDRAENVDDENNIHEQRFAWLLAPIRDLAQNWDIDIAQELEKYLAELGHVVISVDPNETGGHKMNFAEAALLIQGTTGVYSKKVEYLYQLCYELLHTLARQRAAKDHPPQHNPSVDDNGNDADTSSLMRRAADFDDDFLPLDDIPECRDIDLNENPNEERPNAAARASLIRSPMPLSLVPLEDFEKSQLPLIGASGQVLGRRDDFWVNTARIHPGTGALLLDACNVALINAPATTDTFVPRANNQCFGGLNVELMSPTATATPMQLSPDAPKDVQQRAQEPLQEVPVPLAETTIVAGDDDGFSDVGHNDTAANFDPLMEAAVTVAAPPPPLNNAERANWFGFLAAPKQSKKRKTRKEIMDEIRGRPWQEVDPDEEDESDDASGLRFKKLKKSRTFRVPTVGVPTAVEPGTSGQVQLPDVPVADYLDEFVYTHPRKLPRETWKRTSCRALEDAYRGERKARMNARLQRQKDQKTRADGEGGLLPASQSNGRRQSEIEREQEERDANRSRNLHMIFDDDEDGGGDNDDGCAQDADEALMEGMPDADVVVSVFDDVGPATSSHAAMEAPATAMSYEDLVKTRLEQILNEAEKNMVLGDLTRRVREWEKKISPALQEDENRRQFDIHEYGGDLLDYFDQAESASYDFQQFARTQPQWEVCRYFLSSLMLANTRNVELASADEEGTLECINTLNLTLLSKERHHEQLEEYAAPSARDK